MDLAAADTHKLVASNWNKRMINFSVSKEIIIVELTVVAVLGLELI